ncbi:MAG TPA: hypothetical protein VGM82_20960, partial [Gemmatimonadaceae bacterium]
MSEYSSVFLGHYGLAFAAKRAAPDTSLGTLSFAAQFLDELWPILLLIGVEHVRIAPHALPANQLVFTSYPISHSLAMAVVWGALIGATYYVARKSRRAAWIVGLTVVSHWFLDWPVHTPDLPLWPGGAARVGLGLWNSTPATLCLEFGLFGAGLWSYLTQTRARDRTGSWALWSMVVVLLAIFI